MKNWAKWASEYGQITKTGVSEGCGGNTFTIVVRVEYYLRRFESLLKSLSIHQSAIK